MDRDDAELNYLRVAYEHFQGAQFYARQAQFIPYYLLEKADQAELNKNWTPNMVEVPMSEVPPNANVIGSHFVYKVKVDSIMSEGKSVKRLKLKSRLCVHGNKDAERDSLRTDAAVVSHMGFILVYSMACIMGMVIAKADIRGAYTQSGKAKRDVYVEPPYRFRQDKCLWLLKSTVYGIVSAGRKWQLMSDRIVKEILELEPVLGMPQLFVKRASSEEPIDLLAKYVDDLAVAAKSQKLMEEFQPGNGQAVEIGSWIQYPDELEVNSTEVLQTKESVNISATRLSKTVEFVGLTPGRRKDIASECNTLEISKVRSMADKLGYMGVAVSPIAAFAASYIQQIVPKMIIAGVKHANGIARDILRRENRVCYLRPTVDAVRRARIVVFSDAGFPHKGAKKKVAQEGCILGIAFGVKTGSIFHGISWLSRKQRRCSHSSTQAECIAAMTSLGCAMHIKSVWNCVTGCELPITLVIDSLGLHKTFSTQATPTDASMTADVHALRLDYESGCD